MLARRRQERVDQRKADLDYDEKKLQELDEINAAKDAVLDARAQAVGEICKKQVSLPTLVDTLNLQVLSAFTQVDLILMVEFYLANSLTLRSRWCSQILSA